MGDILIDSEQYLEPVTDHQRKQLAIFPAHPGNAYLPCPFRHSSRIWHGGWIF